MFGVKTKSDGLSRTDISRLDKIDLAYMRAYTLKTIDGLRGMLAPACLDKVGWLVHSFNTKYFADDKFRHTDWTVMNISGNIYTLKKQVTFDKIRINAAMSINAASNYSERWIISKKNGLIVMDIEAWNS